MRKLVWSVFLGLALLWSVAAWLAYWVIDSAVQWSLAGDAAGDAAAVGWQLPAWIIRWVDVAQLHRSLDLVQGGIDALHAAGPWFGEMLGWLLPIVWLTWGFGLTLLLVPTLILHALLRARPAPPGGPGAAASPAPASAPHTLR